MYVVSIHPFKYGLLVKASRIESMSSGDNDALRIFCRWNFGSYITGSSAHYQHILDETVASKMTKSVTKTD